MKKILMVAGAITLIIVVLGAAGIAYAQGGIPPVGWTNEDGNTMPMMGGGNGMRGLHGNSGITNEMGSMARMGGAGMHGSGPLADYMHAAMAEALGLSVEDLQARIDAGDTAWDIAAEQGLTTEEFQALMATARQTAIDQALADGVITAEQAERMFNGPAGAGMGNCDGQNCDGSGVPGDCPNGGGMHGRNGQQGTPQDNTQP